jgi:hypothetical protein
LKTLDIYPIIYYNVKNINESWDSMSIIPHCFSHESETYITIPALKTFLRESDYDQSLPNIRQDLFEAVEAYGAASDSNKERVLQWLDTVLREGITELHINTLDFDMETQTKLQSGSVSRIVSGLVQDLGHSHICGQSYREEFSLVSCIENTDGSGRIISFCLSKYVYALSSKKTAYRLIYPVFIDLDIDQQIIIARGKPKSNIYKYTPEPFDIVINSSTTIDRELRDAIKFVERLIKIKLSALGNHDTYKNQLYKLLVQYTTTPTEIQRLIDQKGAAMQDMCKLLKEDICRLPDSYDNDVQWDVSNLIEKYFSISYPNKGIFTEGKEAYPLKLTATDEEDSKVEQTAAYEDPLQSKAIFFDNKKMLQKSGVCDGVTFCFTRILPLYYNKIFKVVMMVRPTFFMVKFPEFTVEEDIQNVLSALFNA